MLPFDLKGEIIDRPGEQSSPEELRKVLEGERFIRLEEDHPAQSATGDLYWKKDNGNHRYFLNIRAQCDLVRKGNSPDLYCLKGNLCADYDHAKYGRGLYRQSGIEEGMNPIAEYGTHGIVEKITHAIVPCIHDGKIVEFSFTDFRIISVKKLKADGYKRVGRLTLPYIVRIQQRFGLFMQRQGLPRVPSQVFSFDTHPKCPSLAKEATDK